MSLKRGPNAAILTGLISLLLLAGCGFQPLYATPAVGNLSGLSVQTGQTRLDYLLQDELETYFGTGRSPYQLVVTTETRERRLGLSAQARARRYALETDSRYRVLDGADVLTQGRVREQIYFDAPRDPYALIAARASAEERAASAIARLVAQDIAVRFSQQDTRDRDS